MPADGNLNNMQVIQPEKSVLSFIVVRGAAIFLFCFLAANLVFPARADQTVELKGDAGGKRFDGIGALSGGAAPRPAKFASKQSPIYTR